jgi:hypothetical protein
MTPRRKDILSASDFERSPGPCAYAVPASAGKSKAPSYSMKSRPTRKETSQIDNPGPTAYSIKSLFEVNVSKKKGSTLQGRTKMVHEFYRSPGPGAYSVPPASGKRRAPAFSIKSRPTRKFTSVVDNPGPGQYVVPSVFDDNARNKKGSTMCPRRKLVTEYWRSPGPSYYPGHNGTVRKAPSFSMGARFKTKSSYNKTPGPGAYDTRSTRPKSAVTLKSRPKDLSLLNATRTPGPAAYMPRKQRKGPSFTITGKRTTDGVYACSTNPGFFVEKR